MGLARGVWHSLLPTANVAPRGDQSQAVEDKILVNLTQVIRQSLLRAEGGQQWEARDRMLGMRFKGFALAVTVFAGSLGSAAVAGAQEHGRKWEPPPPTAHVVVKVVKGFDGKPFENAGVVFHAVRDGKDDGNLEVKTDPDGNATIDVLEVGSHVLVQVIADGFATAATEFDLTSAGYQTTVKLQRPRAQVSTFVDNDGKASQTQPGTQERKIPASSTSSPQ